jgi:hypothetical protein
VVKCAEYLEIKRSDFEKCVPMAEIDRDYIKFPKGSLKKRGKDYVVYNYAWLKENWQTELKVMGIECEDCISRKVVLDLVEDMTDQFGIKHRVVTEGVISMLPPVTPKPKTDVFDKIRAEIEDRPSYMLSTSSEWERGVDAMLGQTLMIIDKYKAESEE